MARRFTNAPAVDDTGVEFERCSACGMPNKLGRSPEGGRYNPPSTVASTYTVPTSGDTRYVYDDVAAANGCVFCGCPDWHSGGSLGDLKR